MPTLLNSCPWLLLIVIQKANLTGNCKRSNLNGTVVSDGHNLILGINTVLPTKCSEPDITLQIGVSYDFLDV